MDPTPLLPSRRLLVCASSSIGITGVPQILGWIHSVAPETEITVVMTRNAARIIPPSTFGALTGRPAYSDWIDAENGSRPLHIVLAQWAEAIAVLPATANIIGKAANGIADDLVTSCLIASRCPVTYFPSMNDAMWQNKAVARNVAILRQDGARVADPVDGRELATGQIAIGALPSFRDVIVSLASAHGAVRASPVDGRHS